MALLSQVVNIHYRGNHLSVLAADNRTPLYTIKTSGNLPHMTMIRHDGGAKLIDDDSKLTSSASFKHFSTEVTLSIRGLPVSLQRAKFLSRTSHFTSCIGEVLFWKPDGALTGDFKLVDKKEEVLARFRNKVLSAAEVGSFEIVDNRAEEFMDEVVISGLGMLAMVQSGGLAIMVLFGGDY